MAVSALSIFGETMRAVVFSGIPYNMTVQDVPVPTILNHTDVIVKITTAAICGSDLHYYHGVLGGGEVPFTVGHEGVGYIAEIGEAVNRFEVGDYVVIPDSISHSGLEMGPPTDANPGAGGGIGGLQAEYARIPWADKNVVPIPLTRNTTNHTIEQEFVTVSDIFATGWSALQWSGFVPGDTVAVFGAGPVGLLAIHSAVIQGASRIYAVDHVQQRLDVAVAAGAIPINFVASDPVAQILQHEPNGVIRSIDAVGMESLNADLEIQSDIVLQQPLQVTRREGGIGIVGVYQAGPNSQMAQRGSTLSPNASLSMTELWGKGIQIHAGPVDPKDNAPELVRLIADGKARPSFLNGVEIGIEESPDYYRRFDHQQEVKVFIHFD